MTVNGVEVGTISNPYVYKKHKIKPERRELEMSEKFFTTERIYAKAGTKDIRRHTYHSNPNCHLLNKKGTTTKVTLDSISDVSVVSDMKKCKQCSNTVVRQEKTSVVSSAVVPKIQVVQNKQVSTRGNDHVSLHGSNHLTRYKMIDAIVELHAAAKSKEYILGYLDAIYKTID